MDSDENVGSRPIFDRDPSFRRSIRLPTWFTSRSSVGSPVLRASTPLIRDNLSGNSEAMPEYDRNPSVRDSFRRPPYSALPNSSDDLLVPKQYIMDAATVYEFLQKFNQSISMIPFRIEDFCAALMSNEQSSMLMEIHIALLRTLLRHDDSKRIQFGSTEQKDSTSIALHLIDPLTWPEVLRSYIESHESSKIAHEILTTNNYPFVGVADRLKVLKFLTDKCLDTDAVREDIADECGNDDECRICDGDDEVICCDTCKAVFHLTCTNPPLDSVPAGDYQCNLCRSQQVPGVTDCKSVIITLGVTDRKHRMFSFIARRILVENLNTKEVWYYSSVQQFQKLINEYDKGGVEQKFWSKINHYRDEIIRQMEITEDLTDQFKGDKTSYFDAPNEPEAFKLGQEENGYKMYVNQYSINEYALTKQHRKDNELKKQQLSKKFSLTQASQFNWYGPLIGGEMDMIHTLRQTLLELPQKIPAPFMHSIWSELNDSWSQAVSQCNKPSDFAKLLVIFEMCTKNCIYVDAWQNLFGHIILDRINPFKSDKEKKMKQRKNKTGRGKPKAPIVPMSGKVYLTETLKRFPYSSMNEFLTNELKHLSRLQGTSSTKEWIIYRLPEGSRPLFETCWLIRTMTAQTLANVAHQLRILWCCLRWDDMIESPPPSFNGKIVETTNLGIVLTELLRFSEKTGYLRSIVRIPYRHSVVAQPIRDASLVPNRSGLRKRKQSEVSHKTGKQITEHWIEEDQLELWEIKLFSEKLKLNEATNEPRFNVTWVNRTETFTNAFVRFYEEQLLCDLEIKAEEKLLYAHRSVLSIVSPTIKDVLPTSDWLTMEKLEFDGFKYDTIKKILEFVYNGQVTLDKEKLTDFMQMAEFLKIRIELIDVKIKSIGGTEEYTLNWSDHIAEILIEGFKQLREAEEYFDVALEVQGKWVKAHRFILSAYSTYFEREIKEIGITENLDKFPNVTHSLLSDILSFIYDGEVKIDDVMSMVKAGKSLDFNGLTIDCLTSECVSPDNVSMINIFARTKGSQGELQLNKRSGQVSGNEQSKRSSTALQSGSEYEPETDEEDEVQMEIVSDKRALRSDTKPIVAQSLKKMNVQKRTNSTTVPKSTAKNNKPTKSGEMKRKPTSKVESVEQDEAEQSEYTISFDQLMERLRISEAQDGDNYVGSYGIGEHDYSAMAVDTCDDENYNNASELDAAGYGDFNNHEADSTIYGDFESQDESYANNGEMEELVTESTSYEYETVQFTKVQTIEENNNQVDSQVVEQPVHKRRIGGAGGGSALHFTDEDFTVVVQIGKSKRGADILIHDGYTYNRNYRISPQKGGGWRWMCTKHSSKKCNFYAYTKDFNGIDMAYFPVGKDHTHGPN